ncbi:alpha/beta hydrolase [Virgisporangium aurantiacum]|uniref:DUF1023 domain-containing protein n=1 Tax=Virgisporangium aurantiacum TaxID=175570 RepID=A0A8J4DY97_9ACTN|nr:alpha/beta hydrolase [Virgisporangium aurantiacum]GIJ54416.1 hypothetical protein Vau01_019320 [Virgisporangium aurantiacum]
MTRRLLLAVAAMALAPASTTMLAAPGHARPVTPVGAAAWRADPRGLPDPVTTEPDAVRRYFAGLGDAEQRDLARTYPGVVGNLDGAPVDLRYRANAAAGHDGILGFDPRGRGRVAQVFGDLATADRIAVLVPGAGNRLGNFWRGVGGKAFRSPARQGADLFDRARASGPTERFAVVVWLGYEPPARIDVSAAREDRAREGALALGRFVAGLAAVRPHATVALLGYSYGSTVIGVAAPHLPPTVTDIVAVGSPGMGVDHVTRLGTTARVWAALSRHDVMRFVPGVRFLGLGHGRQPADPAFGATVVAARDVVDHDHYLAAGVDSQATLARIALLGRDRP